MLNGQVERAPGIDVNTALASNTAHPTAKYVPVMETKGGIINSVGGISIHNVC